MAETLRTLINVTDTFETDDLATLWAIHESLGELGFQLHVHKEARDVLEGFLNDDIYFIDPQPDEDWISGVSNPERLKEEAKEWNKNIIEAAVSAINELEELKKTYDTTLGDFIRFCEDSSISKNSDDVRRYELIRYKLTKAFEDLENNFCFGNNHMVIDKEKYGYYSFKTRISKELEQKIEEHPEHYAMINLFYK